MATPWIEDARVYEATSDLTQSGLIQTDDFRQFLSKGNLTRTVVMAPKGCGKTLLIKFKRKSLEKSGFKLLPENKLVDVAPGHAPPFEHSQIDHIRKDPQFWSMLWQVSITCAVVKSYENLEPSSFDPPIKYIFENEFLHDPFQIFAQLLRSNPKYFFAAFSEFQSHLLPIYSKIHQPTAVFIDSVDEFFSHHLIDQKRHGLYGQIAEDFWHSAQFGLLLAIRYLFGHNPHIKTFAAIRTEAFNAKKGEIADLANLTPHTVNIRWSEDDLLEIFQGNIRIEKPARLADPQSQSDLERFFGAQNMYLRHTLTATIEPVFDYILRHTLSRPRDLMKMGHALSAIRPERRNPETIKQAVNNTAAEIAESFIGEASPHHSWFAQSELFKLIDRNVLNAEDMLRICNQYAQCIQNSEVSNNGASGWDAFADLHECGLVGTVSQKPYSVGAIQKFKSVFDAAGNIGKQKNSLPDAKEYIVHSVLGSYLHNHSDNFAKHANSLNIIRPDAEWIPRSDMRFVLQADVKGYTQIIQDPAAREAFPRVFEEAKKRATLGIEFSEPIIGDRFAISDQNGYVLVRAAQKIANALRTSMFGVELRFGLDLGIVRLEQIEDSTDVRFGMDIAVQRSARLENCSAPGHILMLPQSAEELKKYDIDWPFFQVEYGDERFNLKRTQGKWQIGKPGEDAFADELIALPLYDFTAE